MSQTNVLCVRHEHSEWDCTVPKHLTGPIDSESLYGICGKKINSKVLIWLMFLTDIMLLASEGDPKIPKEQKNAKKKKKKSVVFAPGSEMNQDLEQNY